MTQNKERDDKPFLVPRNLEECFSELEDIQGVESWLKMNEDDALCEAHHSVGRWIRNCWNLWAGGDLADYFNEMGIKHPDDMSSIILKSFHRKMNGKEMDVEGQVEYYIQYWKDAEKHN